MIEWIKNKISKSLLGKYIGSGVRKCLAGAGGLIIGAGVVIGAKDEASDIAQILIDHADSIEGFITAGILFLGSLLWGLVQKKKDK